MYEQIREQANEAVTKLLEVAKMHSGDVFVVGCSTSEVMGERIGSHSSIEVADAIFDGIYSVLKEKGIELAAQCCEHLNRAIIIEKRVADKMGLEIVNVVPQPKAGSSFASAAYKNFECPVAVEAIKAHAGIDIGGTMIGMHLKPVAVPVRVSVQKIGEAYINCARTRPKYVGGPRANYNDNMM